MYERESTKADFFLTKGTEYGLRAAIGAAFGLALTGTILSGASSGGLVYFIKLFQILDILGNLSKVNVKFGYGIEQLFTLINNLRIPIIPAIQRMSPIERNDVIRFRRGTRGKLTDDSEETFVIYGQMKMVSMVIAFSYLTGLIIERIKAKGKVLKLICSINSLIKYGVFNLLYFDLMIVAFSNLSSVEALRGYWAPAASAAAGE